MCDVGEDGITAEAADEDGGHRERILEESTLFRGVDRLKLIHAIICYHGPGTVLHVAILVYHLLPITLEFRGNRCFV